MKETEKIHSHAYRDKSNRAMPLTQPSPHTLSPSRAANAVPHAVILERSEGSGRKRSGAPTTTTSWYEKLKKSAYLCRTFIN